MASTRSIRFRALDFMFDLEVIGAAPTDLLGVLSGLRVDEDGTADVSYTVRFDGSGRGHMLRNGATVTSATSRVLGQLLITEIGEEVVRRATSPLIHATTLRTANSCLMLVGASGQGKSTLAAALLLRGAQLVAEDISAVSPEGAIRPFHRPLGLSEAGFSLLGQSLPERASAEPARSKILVDVEALGTTTAGTCKPDVIVIVDKTTEESRHLTPASALARFLELGVVQPPITRSVVEAVAGLVSGADAFEIGTAALDRSVAQLLTLEPSSGPAPDPNDVFDRGNLIEAFIAGEGVLVEDGRCHLLNGSATHIWLLARAGSAVAEIASATGLSQATVADTVEQIGRLRPI